MLQRGNSGDECELASTLYKYDLSKCELFVLSWNMSQTIEAGKYLFRAANVW